MSRFFSSRYADLEPYTPGEQPQERKFIKLNTNESPFPPSEKAMAWGMAHLRSLNLYSDPSCLQLNEKLAELCGVDPEEILVTNGSDEILNFAFRAFCDERRPAVFPDITYGFYPVFAAVNRLPFREVPLGPDLSLDPDDYRGAGGMVVIANPNAPTGMLLGRDGIETILRSNPDQVVVVDEAYIDFGGESCIPLIRQYDNLLVTQTFSKSRSMAGGRLGYGVACRELIRELNTMKYSTNPYNINSLSMAVGRGILEDEETVRANCAYIARVRDDTARRLAELGFSLTDSKANFLFARSDRLDGETVYRKLRERGVLVRHFTKERIRDYNRITVGTEEQMQLLPRGLEELLEESV